MPRAELIVGDDGLLNRLLGRDAAPIGKDVGSDEIHRRGELRRRFSLAFCFLRLFGISDPQPHVEGFASRHRYRALAFDPPNDPDQVINRLVRAQHRLVADHDRIDIAVAASERERGLDFPLVAVFILVDPDAKRDLEPELRGNCRYEFNSTSRAIGTNGVGVRAEDLEVGADLLRRRAIAVVRML